MINDTKFVDFLNKFSDTSSNQHLLTDEEWKLVNILCVFYSSFENIIDNTFFIQYDYNSRTIKTEISFCDKILQKEECITIKMVVDPGAHNSYYGVVGIQKFNDDILTVTKPFNKLYYTYSLECDNLVRDIINFNSLKELNEQFDIIYNRFKFIKYNVWNDDGKD